MELINLLYQTKINSHERIKKCIVVNDEWTVDSGLLTPTLKIKRHNVEARYKPFVDATWKKPQTIVWEAAH